LSANPCEVCMAAARIVNGIEGGASLSMTPPPGASHPQCRCAVELVFEE
jgi:hypothetical protein